MTLTPVEWGVLVGAVGLGLSAIGYFLKRTMNKADEHDKSINHIQQTYVTKDELKELKRELRDDYKKLADDVAEIKDNYIKKEDFHRAISDLTRSVDKVYELLLREKGGFGSG